MSTRNGQPNFVSCFFIIDYYYLSQNTGDDADFTPAILFSYPQTQPTDDQYLDWGQIVGLSRCLAGLFSSQVSEFHYKNSIVSSAAYGRHSTFLLLDRDRCTAEETKLHLQRILSLFHFLFGTFNEMQTVAGNIETVKRLLAERMTPVVDYVFHLSRSIPSLFSSIKYLPLTRVLRPIVLDAKHFLQHLQSKFDVHGGLLAYDQRILHSTFDNDTTYFLQSMFKILSKLPNNAIRHPAGQNVTLRSGVSLLRIFFFGSSSSEDIGSEPPSPIASPPSPPPQMPLSSTRLKPSDSIVIRNTMTTNRPHIYDSSPSPFANGSHRRSFAIFNSESPAISSGETGFDTDQNESSRYSPPRLLNRQNAVSSPPEKSSRWSRGLSNGGSSLATASLSPPSNRPDSDPSDSDQLDSLVHINRLSISQIKNDEDESGYDDDQAFPHPATRFYGHDGYRSRSRTMTNGDRPRRRAPAAFVEVSDRNVEQEREETILYVQKNSHMIVAYRLKLKTLSEDYLEKLWFTTMEKLSEVDGQIYTTCNFNEEEERQSNRVKFQCFEDTRGVYFERSSQNNRSYRPTLAPETVALAFAARSKLIEEKDRRMIGFARGNSSLSVDRRSNVRSTFLCQQQPRP